MNHSAASSWNTVSRLSGAVSRSISPENFTGEPGRGGRSADGPTALRSARELGVGWKISPYVKVPAGKTFTLADIRGEGVIQQIWMTLTGNWRFQILRFYWDAEETPAVECPAGDFFCNGWCKPAFISSLPVCVNPGCGFNCYWEMPFRKQARITFENISDEEVTVFYQINYSLGEAPEDSGYFHARFRRVNPLPCKEVYTILDGIEGFGHYVGTYMAWGVNNCGWWGEGEIKFYLDDDRDFPAICGTGTEDYFCGSYNFENSETGQYQEYCTPYAGLAQVIRPDGVYQSQQRFGMYRWHLTDPVRFQKKIRVTIQALGWRSGGRFMPLQDDIASVAYWYLQAPSHPAPPLPDKDCLEVI